jgi:DNA-directed RNA polymerase subunit RPC12/RpoP
MADRAIIFYAKHKRGSKLKPGVPRAELQHCKHCGNEWKYEGKDGGYQIGWRITCPRCGYKVTVR